MKPCQPQRIHRRKFLRHSSIPILGASISCAAAPWLRAVGSSEKINIGVIGLGRGLGLINTCIGMDSIEITHVCDVDDQRTARAREQMRKKAGAKPQGVKDFRRILDDRSVDAVMIATCNHWHAPASILACAAGKHVYVEKPGSHNPREGELLVASARKHRRVVQMGIQRRSYPFYIEAVERLRSGAIGPLKYARCWYNNARPSIGIGKRVAVPTNLDYSLWQGVAPERPYKSNLIHYNWHWHWHWGNGELGNNGIHALDIARWGLGVDYPRRVSFTGGRYHYDDDQETPDTGVATYDFGGVGISWEGSSCHPRRSEDTGFVTFYGEQGTLSIRDTGYRIYDLKGKQVDQGIGPRGDRFHIANFLECIHTGKRPNSDIEEGQKSTLLCHLGNIAYRLGRTLEFDLEKRRVIGDQAVRRLWSREYREGWEPKV